MNKNLIHILTCLTSILFFSSQLLAQDFTLEITIENQPDNLITLGEVKGDKFTPIDSAQAENNVVRFTFPGNTHTGVYRLILGQTLVAKVMNEAPQQLDLIFNGENIILKTDFNAPEDRLQVILSEENRVWHEFKRREILFREELNTLEKEVDYYSGKNSSEKLAASIENYNRLQKRRDEFITEITDKNNQLLASRMILLFREPFLDGYLSPELRKKIFQTEYLKNKNFANDTLIYSQVYTDIIFSYLVSFNQKNYTPVQRENEYKKAVDIILPATNQNPKVYEFILDYLIHGFEVLQMGNVLSYIGENYAETVCKTDEKTTLERKLLSYKMSPGTSVPDFTLNDINGDPVTLSEVQKEKTLLLFWASWCPHCNEMIPYIKSWIKQQNTPVETVAISLDTSAEEWKNAIANLKTGAWFNVSDLQEWDGQVATDYNIYATPTLFIIDKNRKIIAMPVTTKDLAGLSL
ncbi:TlpA family protein disulfide reductase [Maribellus maritimus]|uniref:TlpA family protein disulfide reductase n=1 Tax=Maribellus maritimus TaxID=2870838 RepID=UPI001EEA7B7A|nr:TlpA disulfide reductase family protein [Maribellus maritimus]MCG6188517.1 TlpA family protein disulfide reductase [Maribellus maritimus]